MLSFDALCVPNVAAGLQRLEKELNLQATDDASVSCLGTAANVRAEELSIESILGSGGFSIIYQVKYQSSHGGAPSDFDSDVSSLASGTSYAMKCLSLPKLSSPKSFFVAARDLYFEATFLAQLDHSNIIRLRGVTPDSLRGSYTQRSTSQGYFILLDLLQGTLRQRLDSWRDQHSRFFKVSSHGTDSAPAAPDGDRRSLAHWSGRLKIASEIAHGMKYLHSKRIVFRDLKPESVGFDAKDGSVKLFDFGLARRIQESFTEPAATGSFRFMAPENMLCQPSGFPADVYSFGVLLWELSTLQLPYESFFVRDKSSKQPVFAQTKFTSQVILKEWRPETESINCATTKELIEQCWAPKPHIRPTFDSVAETVTKAYRVHRKRKQADEAAAASASQCPAPLLRSSSYTFRPRAGSSQAVGVPSRGISRTISDVGGLGGTRPKSKTLSLMLDGNKRLVSDSMPTTIHSTSEESSSSSFRFDDLTPSSQVLPPRRKRVDSLGRRILRKAPSARKLVRSLSSSSRAVPVDQSENFHSADLLPTKPKSMWRSTSPAGGPRRRLLKDPSKQADDKSTNEFSKSAPRRSRSLQRSSSATGKILRTLSGSLKRASKRQSSNSRSSAGSSTSSAASGVANIVFNTDEELSSGNLNVRRRSGHRKGTRNRVRQSLQAAEISASRHRDQ